MGGTSGATRLDGLLSLLDSGSNAGVRKMAAAQVGDLVAAHPSETRPVLRRVRRLLKSTTWETRIAASHAIAAIAEHAPRFVPALPKLEPVKDEQLKNEPTSMSLVKFDKLDIEKLMAGGAMLFGSSGDEYKSEETNIAAQRAKLKADLGLDDRFSSGDMLGLKDEDLAISKMPVTNGLPPTNVPATADVVAEMEPQGLSARERNRKKREAKKRARMGGTSASRPSKRPRTSDSESAPDDGGAPEVFSLRDLSTQRDEEDEEFEREFGYNFWDFQATCEVFKQSLLEPRWEWRHGAAIGLREILMRHATSAGRCSPGQLGDHENARWLEDVCCRLLCVLAMDRFGDFVGDAVVAPVREAAAMTIGASSRALSPEDTRHLIARIFFLLTTQSSSQWEVRHAALLGARYILAVKDEMAEELIRLSFQSITDGLRDQDDDVRAVAAEALLPVVHQLIAFMPHQVPGLVTTLWDALLDLDDISASTSSVLPISLNGKRDHKKVDTMSATLLEIVPRLWPFLRHNSKSVRRAAIELLETLTKNFDNDELLTWVVPLFSDLVSRLFRNILLEPENDTLEISQRVWKRILLPFVRNQSSTRVLVRTAGQMLKHWMQVSAQETRAEASVYDESHSAPISEGPYDGVLMQQHAAEALGFVASLWPPNDFSIDAQLFESMRSPFANARRLACDICTHWAELSHSPNFVFSERIRSSLENEVLSKGGCVYAEVGSSVGSFFTDSLAFLNTVPESMIGGVIDTSSLKIFCMEGKKAVMARDSPSAAVCARSIKTHMTALLESLESLRMRILSSIGYTGVREDSSRIALTASATSALVSSTGTALPDKVAPFIKSLMAALRTSKNPHLQTQATIALSKLALRLSERESQKPLSLMMKNLMKYLTTEQQTSEKLIFLSAKSRNAVELDGPALAKRGALFAFNQFCKRFGAQLFEKLPWLWNRIRNAMTSYDPTVTNEEINQAMIVLRAIVGHVSAQLHEVIASLLPCIVTICAAPHDAYSRHAPQCLADVVAAIPGDGMQNVISGLVPLLSGRQDQKDADISARRGAAKALRAVVDRMGAELIPYAAFMVVPMMTRMVDEDEIVRKAAAGVFGTLVRLMPLEGGAPDDPRMSQAMAEERKTARTFLGQLLGTEPRSHYELPVSIGDGITLRKYQQECLDWLAFLNRYELHGALCDDMGLGKTLMTLCIIAGDFVNGSREGSAFPALVACPSTIVAHWCEEAQRFFGHVLPSIVQYSGSPRERARLRGGWNLSQSALVVTSYDVLSNDLRFFENVRWNYVVLDEGHVIKNPKTRVAKAVRSLSARHRLVLTGTPIQNSVLELWAMFDFLMPGFLGSEKSFKDTFAKPIMASREGKCNETDQERGMVATEALHRQVLPFVLRRLKDDVLDELPPKIMQDYYCVLTPLQKRLYEDFQSEMSANGNLGSSGGKSSGGTHVFTALNYMRRLCSHPKLVLSRDHPEYEAVHKELRTEGKTINDIDSSAKLVGLMNVLKECGIGNQESGIRDSGGHRVLIFAQLKNMLDIVEKDLFKVHMPDVTYLRLDGSVETSKRQPIVTRFNADPTIDCLLLTTHVGGLGLNLTGADTVIFLEHDWNPTKDLQAMDRAHRMGQKRTVNVYRLIARGTLEEKIMGIQKFKTHIANTVVNRENSNLQSMNTDQLLDLFKVEDEDSAEAMTSDDAAAGTGKGMKAALSGLGELWEEKQYEDEFDMENFLSGMQSLHSRLYNI
ncbi:unnamed protein product [Chondrus crispus]|uniref:Uncharacterized protein n=1 Tax=Chondrus crispus TaxID=2769 RepID=R7Q3N2_CHOCR|nr:unnamed protein product [Chondrus crispus]CDF32085.1 unnamed protein product [Chondrus crispus]|eukprot:XP_005711750.1 unnamed protein product [Chondrus crispus]